MEKKINWRRKKEMMKCMDCSYSTNDNEQKFCPYDGSKLVDSDEDFDGSKLVELDEDD